MRRTARRPDGHEPPAPAVGVRRRRRAQRLRRDATPTDHKSSYLERADVRVQQAVSVTASVLDDQESLEYLGARLNLVGIQPVWIKIQNRAPIPTPSF